MPVIALVTLVSGFWLYQRLSGGAIGALLKTPAALAFGLGGLAALLAFVVGIALARPFMMRTMKLAEQMTTCELMSAPAAAAAAAAATGRTWRRARAPAPAPPKAPRHARPAAARDARLGA